MIYVVQYNTLNAVICSAVIVPSVISKDAPFF